MIEQPKLPFEMNALEPYISEKTLSFHYGKHHATYVKNVNDLIKGTSFEDMELEDIVVESAKDAEKVGLFNNAAQAWNHTFFWNSLTNKSEDKMIPDQLMRQILRDFGSLEVLLQEFKKAAVGQFGSGWAWLVFDKDKLKIISTGNAYTPITTDELVPLLCVDVWEHAYYLDYQNVRATFVDNVLQHCLNWKFAGNRFIDAN